MIQTALSTAQVMERERAITALLLLYPPVPQDMEFTQPTTLVKVNISVIVKNATRKQIRFQSKFERCTHHSHTCLFNTRVLGYRATFCFYHVYSSLRDNDLSLPIS